MKVIGDPELVARAHGGDESARRELLARGCTDGLRGVSASLDAVADCHDWGWSTVPHMPAEKEPYCFWEPHVTHRPSLAQQLAWYRGFDWLGVALLLGTLSNVFAVKVRGPKAHDELLKQCGDLPTAPKVLWGDKPYRYSVLFRYPDFKTEALATPWNAKLEFCGHGGFVILPPSLPRRGECYRWAHGHSPQEVELPVLPDAIQESSRFYPFAKRIEVPSRD